MPLPLCILTEEEKEARRIHSEIERQLRQQKRLSRREYKLLLLGAGEVGKSTFVKQMRIIHGKGYSEEDRRNFIALVHGNIVQAMAHLLEAMKIFGIPYQDPLHEAFACVISKMGNELVLPSDLEPRRMELLSTERKDMIITLWSDKGVQEAYTRRRSFLISDSAGYYLNDLGRIFDTNYTPSISDVLRVRLPTKGILEYPFMISNVVFRIVDVGGQRSERRKWIHCFDNVTSILFLVSLVDYDQTLLENPQENRLKESLALFDTISTCQWFRRCSIILFLNKTDLLEEKIHISNLVDHFPQFEGPPRNSSAARQFILDMLTNRHVCRQRQVYHHFTCATDTQNVKVVLESVKDTVIRGNLREDGIA